MAGLLRASINSLRSLAYGTSGRDDESIGAKPSSSHSSLRQSLRSSDAEPTLNPLPPTTARDIPGSFPADGDKIKAAPTPDPANIPLPASVQDDEHFKQPPVSALDTSSPRKRKRAPTDLPSRDPTTIKTPGIHSIRERPRTTREKFFGFLTGKQLKSRDDSDKENEVLERTKQSRFQSQVEGIGESTVTSILRDRSLRRRQPKHLQSTRWAKKVFRPSLGARPLKRPRYIPSQAREGEESEDELANPAIEHSQGAEKRSEKEEAKPDDGALLGSFRGDDTDDGRRGDLDSFFDEPDVIKMRSLSISSGMQKLIEEKRRLHEEEVRKRAEARRKAEEAERRREQELRLAKTGGLRIPKQQFVIPVGDDWKRRAHDTLAAAPNASLASTAEGTELRRHDFAKIVPPTVWLNDEIVNGALLWLDRAINSAAGIKDPKKQTRKCLALSSFFWKRLVELQGKNTQRTLRRSGVEQRNFLDVETILLPICESSHWTLVVVRPTKRTIAYMDSMRPDRPVGDFKRFTNLTLAWLRDVLGPKFEEEAWKVIRHDAPRQNNGYDCGVFTITNAMCVALGLSPIDSYREEDMPAQRIRIACMLLNNGFSGDFDLGVY